METNESLNKSLTHIIIHPTPHTPPLLRYVCVLSQLSLDVGYRVRRFCIDIN